MYGNLSTDTELWIDTDDGLGRNASVDKLVKINKQWDKLESALGALNCPVASLIC